MVIVRVNYLDDSDSKWTTSVEGASHESNAIDSTQSYIINT
jgi:hypothetical protein